MEAAFDLTELVAAEFGMHPTDFVEAIGGSWYSVDLTSPPAHADEAQWYGTGKPVMAMLGVDRERFWVGRPIVRMGGLVGPERVEVFVTDIFERDDSTPDEVGLAVASAIWAEREHRDVCRGCREFMPVSSPAAYSGRYCTGCQERYLGIIAC